MVTSLLTIKAQNLIRNLCCGVALTLVGILRATDVGAGVVVAACLTLAFGVLSLWTSHSVHGEASDEMSRADEGTAAHVAVTALLAAAGFLCFTSISLGVEPDVVSSCCMVVGVTLTAYGAAFAVLEREDTHVDYEDERV